MADEDNGAKANEANVPDRRPDPPKRSSDASEWTASDRRGPLQPAEETDDAEVERIVPAHEVDAEGSQDHAVTTPTTSEALSEGPPPASEHHVPPPTETETPPAAPATVTEPRHTPAWPILVGLIGGAVVGAAVAALVFSMQGGSAVDGQVTSLAARVDSLEKRPDPQAAVASVRKSLGELQSQVAALPKVSAPTEVSAPPKVPAPTAKPAPAFDPADLQNQIAALQTKIDDLKKQSGVAQDLATKLAALEGAVAGVQKQASSAQSSADAVATQQKSLEGKVGTPALAVVADSLVEQIDQGQPYAAQMDALASLNADPAKVAVLRQFADKGVPSAKDLALKFAPLAEPMLETEHKAPPNAGFLDRLKSGMTSLVSVRRSDDLSGTDLPSRVARLQADLAHDDVGGALATWSALPADAKAKSEDWAALAKTSAAAMAAARGLQRDAIASLGSRKS